MGRTVDQERMGVRCARISFGVEIKNEAVLFSPRRRETIGAVRMPSEPCDESDDAANPHVMRDTRVTTISVGRLGPVNSAACH